MAYGAILENESTMWNKGRPFFVRFRNMAEYMRTIAERPYLVTVLAPATEEDMQMFESRWLESRKKCYF